MKRLLLDKATVPGGVATAAASGDVTDAGDGDLFVTSDPDRAMKAAARGATAWTVLPGTGELDSWADLDLAMSFASGTLVDVVKCLSTRVGQKVLSGSWTPQGDVMAETADGMAVFATAGPDGESPQVFLGHSAEERKRDAEIFAGALLANQQVSDDERLSPGQTHSLTDGAGHRPILRRHRFSLTGG